MMATGGKRDELLFDTATKAGPGKHKNSGSLPPFFEKPLEVDKVITSRLKFVSQCNLYASATGCDRTHKDRRSRGDQRRPTDTSGLHCSAPFKFAVGESGLTTSE